ncbi:hypothetical protein [Sandaracinus amylolyticus]|uniref:hypothetical protein n=1 Tax=Sandaracinus amylolyticus TaxID=927083 RepID=UPI001F3113E9|nr:hypothetical protein [Sandaracinus amylolyticus]
MHAISLVATWRGGAGIAVVSVVHNGQRIPVDDRTVHSGRCSVSVDYRADRTSRHRVSATFSFIGDRRSHLTLYCLVDGVLVVGPVQSAFAEHRWEIEVAWRSNEIRGGRSR